MGLDMYLKGNKYMASSESERPKEDGYEVQEKTLRLGYWRKHPDLHGYIVRTFADGKDECQEIDLSKEDMEQIIKAIQEDELPNTTGFFFGDSENDEKQKREAIDIFVRAIKWLEKKQNGVWKSVVYQASW